MSAIVLDLVAGFYPKEIMMRGKTCVFHVPLLENISIECELSNLPAQSLATVRLYLAFRLSFYLF
jgi:hypothetical protein